MGSRSARKGECTHCVTGTEPPSPVGRFVVTKRNHLNTHRKEHAHARRDLELTPAEPSTPRPPPDKEHAHARRNLELTPAEPSTPDHHQTRSTHMRGETWS